MMWAYDKIEERWEAEAAVERRLARERWVVTEKIHGAHFVVVGEAGGSLRFAKRREVIPPGESFFGHEVLVARLRDGLERAVAAARRAWANNTATVQLHGELFGGKYPHPDIPPEPGVEAVQAGVWYSPRIEFCVFDIAIVSDGERMIAPYDEVLELVREAGLLGAEPIVMGTVAEARAVAVERESELAARLGLPKLAERNLAEGIVMKTVREVVLPDGTRVRPIVKRKIAAFAEDERYRGGEKPRAVPRTSSNALARLLEAANGLVNPPRIASARSKVGDDAERVIDGVREDVLEELQRRHAADMAALSDGDRRILGDQIAWMARAEDE